MNLFLIFLLLPVKASHIPDITCQQNSFMADCSNANLDTIPDTVNRNVSITTRFLVRKLEEEWNIRFFDI